MGLKQAMQLIKLKKLEFGDTIALIAPSSGLAGIFPHRLDNTIKFLQSEGYHIKEYSATRRINGHESAPAKERARNIMETFTDKTVKAVITNIEGEVANQTLEFLDFKKIRLILRYFEDIQMSACTTHSIRKPAG